MSAQYLQWNVCGAQKRSHEKQTDRTPSEHEFSNVERIAAKRIGRETVQYVSNIYKYWVAYKLVL